jgi:nickel-type superoxide dismutase maturation protease
MRMAKLLAGIGLGGTIALAVARRPRRVEVSGDSMQPTLAPGDRLLVRPSRRPLPGDVVAIADPRRPGRTLVKRVSAVDGDGSLVVAGDNPAASTDSRTFGAVPRHLVRGVAFYRYGPAGRSGRLPLRPVP